MEGGDCGNVWRERVERKRDACIFAISNCVGEVYRYVRPLKQDVLLSLRFLKK